MLFSEPKIPQFRHRQQQHAEALVSVLFSEPKIPQLCWDCATSSALLRVSVLFSEPKIPQLMLWAAGACWLRRSFSALQRAENSSIGHPLRRASRGARVSVLFSEPKIPQLALAIVPETLTEGFSALQRAENSSIRPSRPKLTFRRTKVSVLFSEPKIPQLCDGARV